MSLPPSTKIQRSKVLLIRKLSVFLASAVTAAAADWPAWRGPTGHGSVESGQYPTAWGTNGITWKLDLPGKGGSCPIVWKNRIYLTTPADGQDALLALDSAGHQTWLTRLGAQSAPKHKTLGSSCNSSPVTDGSGIFAYYRSGQFAAVELDGSIRWNVNLNERFGPEKLYWDQGSSPILTDAEVILARLHQGDSWIAGFDKRTGETRWKVKRNYPAPSENDNGYATPLLFEQQGRKALLIWGSDQLTAHLATDGKLLWELGGFNPAGTANWPAIATPVILGNLAVVPVGRDDHAQAHVHGIRLRGTGDTSGAQRVWQRDDLGVFVTSPAAFRGQVFLLRHRGEVVCLNPVTGKTVWFGALPRGTASYYASPVIGNGILYAAREDGVVFAARVTDRFELLSENPLGERVLASPVLADNRLLVRGDQHLFCIAGPKP